MATTVPYPPASAPQAAILRSVLDGRGAMVRFTVRDVRMMLDHGILPDDATTELLHGVIVRKDRSETGGDPTVVGDKHRVTVNKLNRLTARIDSPRQHVSVRSPVICGEDDAPEPDVAILRGPIEAFAGRTPTGQDAACVIEVADPSLERDTQGKLSVYATAGVPQCVVFDLRNRTVRVHTHPDPAAGEYRVATVLTADENLSIHLPDGGPLVVPIRDLLP